MPSTGDAQHVERLLPRWRRTRGDRRLKQRLQARRRHQQVKATQARAVLAHHTQPGSRGRRHLYVLVIGLGHRQAQARQNVGRARPLNAQEPGFASDRLDLDVLERRVHLVAALEPGGVHPVQHDQEAALGHAVQVHQAEHAPTVIAHRRAVPVADRQLAHVVREHAVGEATRRVALQLRLLHMRQVEERRSSARGPDLRVHVAVVRGQHPVSVHLGHGVAGEVLRKERGLLHGGELPGGAT